MNSNSKLTPQLERLAMEIATALDDLDSITAHRKYVLTYSEDKLRRTLARTLAVPEDQIRKSRGALFTTLLKS